MGRALTLRRRAYALVYVCFYCGREVARFPAVRSTEPATMSVCGLPACRAAAARAYRGGM